VIVISVVGGLVLAMAVFFSTKGSFPKSRWISGDLEVELADKNRQLSHVSDVDHLTDLPHRETIKVFLDQYVEVAKRKETALGLLHIDFDHFHDINEEQGTVVGDQVLKAISKRLKTCLRKSDIIGRLERMNSWPFFWTPLIPTPRPWWPVKFKAPSITHGRDQREGSLGFHRHSSISQRW
jgi:hypothetical protein